MKRECCITICPYCSPDADTTLVVLSLIGKFGAAASFSIVYVYASEIFPTEYRSIGVGSCSMFARVGGMVAPLIASLVSWFRFDVYVEGLLCGSLHCLLFIVLDIFFETGATVCRELLGRSGWDKSPESVRIPM